MYFIPLTPLYAHLLPIKIRTAYLNYVLEIGICVCIKYMLLQMYILVQQQATADCGIGSVTEHQRTE
jgi:hypothetical protein